MAGLLHADRALADRIERLYATNIDYVAAYARIYPHSAATYLAIGGGIAGFCGPQSPMSRWSGLGSATLDDADLDAVERFYADRSMPVGIRMSPFAGVALADRLVGRGYRPDGMLNMLVRRLDAEDAEYTPPMVIRRVAATPADARLFARLSAGIFSDGQPAPADIRLFTAFVHQSNALCWIAEIDGQPVGAGRMILAENAVELGGGATLRSARRQGVQTALIRQRIAVGARAGCDLAAVMAEPGSHSQRNLERIGFQVVYTLMSWQRPTDDRVTLSPAR